MGGINGWFSVSFSRKCPYACKFCINQKLRKDFISSTKVMYYRCQSVKKVIADLLEYIARYPEIKWCVLAKEITNVQLEKAFDLFNKYEVRSLAYTMLGIPVESENSVKETIKELIRLKPTLIRMTFFAPFIGTPLYDYCIEKNLFNDSYLNIDNFTKSVVKMDNISNYELSKYHLFFPWFLNIQVNKAVCDVYRQLIEQYDGLIEEEIDDTVVKEEIIKKDRKGISHYRYFPENTNYFNYCKCD